MADHADHKTLPFGDPSIEPYKTFPVGDPSIDPYAHLNFNRNPDGSATRLPFKRDISATPKLDDSSSPVVTRDFLINRSKSTWLRLYVPRQALHNSPTTATATATANNNKLPFIVHYHGGGLVVCSAANYMYQNFCSIIAAGIPIVIASVEYRLAPEHRLPAAYDDAVEALHWIKDTKEDWFVNYVDLSNCFLMGDSAGGNIAYHAGLRVAAAPDLLEPLKIKGLILHHPFFGGTERTESEIRLVNNKVLPTVVSDLMWDLALPVGVDRDHEYCNPLINDGSGHCDKMRELGWKVSLTAVDGDPLFDRQVAIGKMLEKKGVEVVSKFGEGEAHGADVIDPSKTGSLVIILKEFLSSTIKN